ncbi:unnamed protein product [Allacma fusca]|uniref:Uncharacterized protein n=1 Tax=Allacma fusca TaxID=39272 RepID=A0A8J2KBL1_9HEXA|nr:unnamed protein product [Allacma fusca]
MTIVDFSQIRDFQGLGLALNSIIAPLNESMKTFNDFLANYNKKVQEVDDKVSEALKRFSKLKLTVKGGDFNCRIASLGLLPQEIISNSVVSEYRESNDDILHENANFLSALFEEIGLVLLNGRTPVDSPGEYTFLENNAASRMISVGLVTAWWYKGLSNINVKVEGFWKFVKELKESEPQKLEGSPDTIFGSFTAALKQVAQTNKCLRPKIVQITWSSKPWFDNFCRELKSKLNLPIKVFKRSSFSNEIRRDISICRMNFKTTCREKRAEYNGKIQTSIDSSRNSKEFWEAVKTFRFRHTVKSEVGKEKWETIRHNNAQ